MQHRKFQKIISHFSEIPKNVHDILSSFLRVCFRLKNMCSINFVGEKSSTTTTTTNTKHYFNEVKEEHREKKIFSTNDEERERAASISLHFLSLPFLLHSVNIQTHIISVEKIFLSFWVRFSFSCFHFFLCFSMMEESVADRRERLRISEYFLHALFQMLWRGVFLGSGKVGIIFKFSKFCFFQFQWTHGRTLESLFFPFRITDMNFG